ncbi:hypothetical protein CDD81_7935 [Ophiocordyceps australis]|uniref:TIP41-like protein n=1 Tax=Ophiocordyceps australis TaxID=1399860 RepID=A0A2C5Y3N3_9HYPO|nr:hypothetical protein CDD81_7935 [Ophiocordyceps australis]
MNHISSPNEPWPSPQDLDAATTTHIQGDFAVATRKLPISKSGAIDALSERIGIPLPEMIFGDNMVQLKHLPTGWTLTFATPDALDAVDKTDRNVLKVAYARDWESSRQETATESVKQAVRPYDWSYSTTYTGTVTTGLQHDATNRGQHGDHQGQPEEQQQSRLFRPTKLQIPLELLKRRDPMLFFDEVVLYESELDDNGISVYSAKLRVHQRRMLLLCRLFMRLDNVLIRIRDTRVYIDFDTQDVIRDYMAKEAPFQDVKEALLQSGRLQDDVTVALRDANILDPLLSVIEHRTDAVNLKA